MDIPRMLHLGQDAQTDHAIVSRTGKLPVQFTNISAMNVKKAKT